MNRTETMEYPEENIGFGTELPLEARRRILVAEDLILASLEEHPRIHGETLIKKTIKQGVEEQDASIGLWSLIDSGGVDMSWAGNVKLSPQEIPIKPEK